jgi:hypothetical protein
MAHLAQVYIRLRPYEIDPPSLTRLGERTTEIALHAAEQYYRQPVDIDVALDVGTLRSVVTVTGAILLGSYTAIANYKDFRGSVDLLCEQAHDWGTNVCSGFTAASGAKPGQIATKQIRYKTPGELRRFFKDVKRYQVQQKKGDIENAQKTFKLAVQRWRAIREDLTSQEIDLLEQILQVEGQPPLEEWPQPETERAYRPGAPLSRLLKERPEYHGRPAHPPRDHKIKAAAEVGPKPQRVSYRNTVRCSQLSTSSGSASIALNSSVSCFEHKPGKVEASFRPTLANPSLVRR